MSLNLKGHNWGGLCKKCGKSHLHGRLNKSSWNKGLTNLTDERVAESSRKRALWNKLNPHGISFEQRKKISCYAIKRFQDPLWRQWFFERMRETTWENSERNLKISKVQFMVWINRKHQIENRLGYVITHLTWAHLYGKAKAQEMKDDASVRAVIWWQKNHK